MQKNYSPRLVMQIPKENAYTGLVIRPDFDDEFDKLSENYAINQINDVKCFIEKHENILEFIHELTPLIDEYFPGMNDYTNPNSQKKINGLVCVGLW